MKQLESFTIGQFRGLKNLDLQGLGRINILVGQNNSGKTTVLEALSCFAKPLDCFHWLGLSGTRSGFFNGGSQVEALKWLFPQDSESSPSHLCEEGLITLKANGNHVVSKCVGRLNELEGFLPERKREPDKEVLLQDEGDGNVKQRGAKLILRIEKSDGSEEQQQLTVWEQRGLVRRETQIKYSIPHARISLNDYHSNVSAALRFSEFRKEGLYEEAVDVLRLLDPGIKEILVLTQKRGMPCLYVNHKKTGLTPLSVCGDGMRRAVYIATTVPKLKGGILLVDEIESALHVSALEKVFEMLIAACKQYDVQLFATTHSLEAVDTMLNVALARSEIDLVSYRLEMSSEGTSAVRLDEKTLATVRNDLGQEVR